MTLDEFRKLDGQEFIMVATDPSGNGEIMFAIPIPGEPGLDYAEEGGSAFILDPIEDWIEAWDRYIKRLQAAAPAPSRNRTRRKAAEKGAITEMPDRLALPTLKKYQNSLSLVDDPVAHLQIISKEQVQELIADSCLPNEDRKDGTTNLMDSCVPVLGELPEFDLLLLLAVYSIILDDLRKMTNDLGTLVEAVKDPQYIGHNVKVYLPAFLKMLGYSSNLNSDEEESVINRIARFRSLSGVISETANGRPCQSRYQVMLFLGHDARDNTLIFSSPYINAVIMKIIEGSIRRDKKGTPMTKSNGELSMLPSHSYLVKSSIVKERNKRAAEIVCIVVKLIEQAGSHTAHISARTIIDRCPDLKEALKAASSSNKGNILKRAFTGAWKMLPRQTCLEEAYKDIELPDYKDSKNIPTMATLNMVFEFPHKGKGSRRDA